MRGHRMIHRAAAMCLLTLLVSACGRSRQQPPPDPVPAVTVVTAPVAELPAERQPRRAADVPRVVPYHGAFGPNDPPARAPAMQKPLTPWVKAALDVLYERPSPKGPPPIAVAVPKAIYVVGRNPVVQVLPGPAVFPEKIPARMREMLPKMVPFSNNVKQLSRGSIRLVAFDHTLNDTKLTSDSMAVEATFTDVNGDDWRIEQVMLAPLSPNPVAEPWFGGVVIDTLYHGQTGNGTPAEPLVQCAMCSWGWADIYKNDKRVASSAPLHIMVTSDVRAPAAQGFRYQCYDCTSQPVREVHIIVAPVAHLPSPGGFLHLMWENAVIRRGSPQQIAAVAPQIAEPMPTIELSAAPYLTWDRKEIRVRTGQKYRLVVHNQDPSSFHQFHLHSMPSGEGHHGGDEGIRHSEGGTAGGTGPLWKPGGEAGHHAGSGDPPAPRNVFLPLPQGSTWATMVQFDKPGEYEFMCPVGNHYRRGMAGKFIVEGNATDNSIPVRKGTGHGGSR